MIDRLPTAIKETGLFAKTLSVYYDEEGKVVHHG
jgi:hypothetical protein